MKQSVAAYRGVGKGNGGGGECKLLAWENWRAEWRTDLWLAAFGLLFILSRSRKYIAIKFNKPLKLDRFSLAFSLSTNTHLQVEQSKALFLEGGNTIYIPIYLLLLSSTFFYPTRINRKKKKKMKKLPLSDMVQTSKQRKPEILPARLVGVFWGRKLFFAM